MKKASLSVIGAELMVARSTVQRLIVKNDAGDRVLRELLSLSALLDQSLGLWLKAKEFARKETVE